MRFISRVVLLQIYFQSIGQSKEEIAWIKKHTNEISTDLNDFRDLAFLDSLVENKRIVMLGENSHGTAEYFKLKNRLIQYLHNELNFNVLAWESNLLDCYSVNENKRNLTPEEMVNGSLHFVYRTDQVLPIMETVKNNNLTLVGFDAQPTVYSDATANYISSINCLGEKTRNQFHQLDSIAQTPTKMNKKNKIRKAHAKRYAELLIQSEETDCTNKLKTILKLGIEDRIYFLLNRNKGRDERMANNLMWLLNVKYPNEKFIIYAHNAHNDPANQKNKYANFKTMAEFLPNSIIKQTYNIGIFGYSGTARNNVRGIYEFKVHPELSLENYLHKSGYRITFLDIENQMKSESNFYLFNEINTMYWGNINNPKILSEHYDGVILVNDISPSTKLKY